MSRLRAVLDRLNDIEATITKASAEAAPNSAAARIALKSLENRREMLREELADVTASEHVEICDYRLIPSAGQSYAIAGVTTALHEFQNLLTLVFDSLLSSKPKQKETYDPEAVEKTRLDFGYAYAGSLGFALTIQNDRLLFGSSLDVAIKEVFALMSVKRPDEIKNAEKRYGAAVVRKLYSWSRAHRDHSMSAEIKWIREKEARYDVLAQPEELDEICKMIEAEGTDDERPVTLTGVLASWNSVNRHFILMVPDADPVSGYIGKEVDVTAERAVRGAPVVVDLVKHTKTTYVSEKEDISYVLVGIRPAK